MVGRGSRRLGKCIGRVYVNSEVTTADNSGARDFLKARSNRTADVDEGHLIAKAIFTKFPLITKDSMKDQIMNALGDPVKWKTRKDSYRADNNVYKWLSDENYRPSSKW